MIGDVTPSGNGQPGSAGGRLVYAVGSIGVRVESHARGLSLASQISEAADHTVTWPVSREILANYLTGALPRQSQSRTKVDVSDQGQKIVDLNKALTSLDNAAWADKFLYLASSVVWTLNRRGADVLVLQPEGPFARDCYRQLVESLKLGFDGTPAMVAVAGRLTGREIDLDLGGRYPVVVPELRGLRDLDAEFKKNREAAVKEGVPDSAFDDMLARSKEWVLNEGTTSEQRALNFAVTKFLGITGREKFVRDEIAKYGLIHSARAVPSPHAGGHGEFWDVTIVVHSDRAAANSEGGHPDLVWFAKVDVSDIVPVINGSPTIRHQYGHR